MGGVGKIQEFDVKTGNWTVYCERIEMYFLANKIEDNVKLPTLIAVMGEEAYQLLSTLASPHKPAALTYEVAVSLMKNHLQPKPSILAERYLFRQRRQADGETVADYVTELKRLAKTCDFGSTLEENLRDQIVCGIISENTRQRLFAEDDNISFNRAVKLAVTLETAEKNASAVDRDSGSTAAVNKIQNNFKCMACGYNGHMTENCRYKNFECSFCKNVGHLRRMCPEKNISARFEIAKAANNYQPRSVTFTGNSGRGRWRSKKGGNGSGGIGRGQAGRAAGSHRNAETYWVNEYDGAMNNAEENTFDDSRYASASGMNDSEDKGSDDCDDEPMYQMSLSKYRPVCITLLVHNKYLNMEIDTGSALSCISARTYQNNYSELPLHPCQLLKLKFYNGSIIQPLGYIRVDVTYQNKRKTLDLYVIEKGTTTLLGRQWLSELNMEIPKINLCNLDIDKGNRNEQLNNIISRHESLFDGTLGRYKGKPVQLFVREGAEPVFCRARPVPYALRPRVDAELDAMLRAGVIEPVERSDWATPLVIATKPDGGIRLCADYKVTLNRVLMVDRYPVPKVDDLFSNLCGNEYFTKLDLSQAYNQLVLDESSRNFTVINTHRGLFKYNRLVYGLSSSPGIFQKFMENLFKDVPDVIIFYDDILIKNKDINSHLKTIEQVLEILQRNGLKIKKNKCNFLADHVEYLGFIVDKKGLRTNPNKIKAIIDMPPPRNTTELKSFLGMVNFYGKFIKNLSSYLFPLYDLLKKGKHYYWGKEQNDSFLKVKKLLCSTKVLVHYNMCWPTVVTCDASAYGVGAVLSQRAPDGTEKVVSYASRALTSAEINYSQIHKEALAIIFSIDKFHQYLYGRKFVLRTDHKPLVSIFGPNTGIPTTAASRLQRWAIKLSAYDFKIEYVNTDKNTADSLSRLIKTHKEETIAAGEDIPEQTYLHFATEALLLDYKILKKETSSDPILSRVISYITDEWPAEVELKELKPYFNRKNELYCELGCIMWGHRVVIPSTCRTRVIKELHESHMGIVKTKALARSYVWWPGVDEAVEAACRGCAVCASVADAPPAHAPSPWPWPDRPWSRLHLDFLGPMLGTTYLVVVDACSKWIEAIKMNSTTAKALIAVLRDMWARFGLPKQVVSDNGPPFSSAEFELFLKNNGIAHIFSAPYHPASNGAAENAVKICKRVIKKAVKQKVDIDTALNRFLLAYRNTEHYTTGDSPAKILIGRNLRMRLDKLKPDRSQRVVDKQAKDDSEARPIRHRQLNQGDDVWCRDFRSRDKWVLGEVSERLGNTNYKVKYDNGTEVHRHVDQLRRRESALPVSMSIPPKPPSRRSSTLVVPVVERSVTEERSTTLAGEERTEFPIVTSSPQVQTEPEPKVSENKPTTPVIVRPKRRLIKPPIRYGFDE